MKHWQLKDGIQIILAIVLTGTMAYAMQPQASESVQDAPEAQIAVSTDSKPKDAPERQETAKKDIKITSKPKPTKKKVTWRDNPKKCNQDTQYISADPPFKCIDKPVHTESVAQPAAKSVSISGSKQDWMRAAGIPESDWWAVDSIVSRESGWNPNAVNPSSGACGLGQQLPCGKWPGAWNDPVAALRAQYQYVKDRYGGYPQAVAFWNANHWY